MDKRLLKIISVAKTLQHMDAGDTITLTIAGEGRQTSLQSLYATRKRHGLNLSIAKSKDGTKAVVTAL